MFQLSAVNTNLNSLSYKELKRLRHKVESLISTSHTGQVISDREEQISHCPHCESKLFIRYGCTAKGHQRFKCKACKSTFSTLTGTSLCGMRLEEKWQQYSDGMWCTTKLRQAARELGINLKTAWKWRHKLLTKPKQDRQRALAGIVEADETFINESYKGKKQIQHRESRKRGGGSAPKVPIFLALDRHGHVTHQVLEGNTKEQLESVVKKVLKPESVFCTDGNLSYVSIVQHLDFEVEHKRLIGLDNERVKDGVYHIQTINNWTMRFKSWLVQFHGVSTEYLENYIAWFRQMDQVNQLSWVDYALMTRINNT